MKYSIKNFMLLFCFSIIISFPLFFKTNFQIKSIIITIIFVFIFCQMFKKVGLIFLNIFSLFFLFQQIVYYFTASAYINSYYFITLFSTNLDEILSFFTTLNFKKILNISFLFLSCCFLSFYLIKKITFNSFFNNKKLLFVICLIFNLLVINIIYKNLKKHIFVMYCIDSINKAFQISFLNPFNLKAVELNQQENSKAETIVIVIGESSSKSHYSLFGYKNNLTNPLLQQRTDLFKFNNVFSVGPNTQPNVKTLLSGKIADSQDSLPNDLISVSKKIGYTSYYIDNNKFARYDPLVALAKRSDFYWNLNGVAKTEDHVFLDSHLAFDEEITPYFERVLKEKVDKKLIILHMSGSHPAQYKRYPKKWNQLHHLYDNSILYSDYVINSWINLFSTYSNHKNTAFIMISDHGVEFPADCDPEVKGIEGLKSFGANDHYLSSIAVPLIAWFSPQFKTLYSYELNNAKNHESTPMDSRVLYSTIMDLMGAKVVEQKPVQDLSILKPQVNFLPRMNYDSTNIDENIKSGKICLSPDFKVGH
jgi:heptose-I-phosphate ethanolaminephosphotransferase